MRFYRRRGFHTRVDINTDLARRDRPRRRFGALPTLLEWDENLPTLERLEQECQRAREVEHRAIS